MQKRKNDQVKQQLSFRIWNRARSAILVYLLNRSTTWTIPTVEENDIVSGIQSLLSYFPEADLSAAICIINLEDKIPIQIAGGVVSGEIVYQHIIYDTIIEYKGIEKIIPPDNVKASHFMSFESIEKLLYKTPALNYLIKYMKEEEKFC